MTDVVIRKQWTIKSIPKEVMDLTRVAAKDRGMKISGFVEMALRSAIEAPQAQMALGSTVVGSEVQTAPSEEPLFTAKQVASLLKACQEKSS